MEPKIKVKWTEGKESGVSTFSLSEAGCKDVEDWQSLTEEEKESRIETALEAYPIQPLRIYGNYSVSSK